VQLFPQQHETIDGAGRSMRDGEHTSVELVEEALLRIDAQDEQIRAWVIVAADDALATARERDAELAAGRPRGPLHGIPLGIKDIVDVAGLPTAAGSELLAKLPAEQDATLVARLRTAGAVILGKTVTTQYACYDPPVTVNPWNRDHTPGGSSSGSAAAVASGMCLGAIGSQTGGSITRPAAFCGIAGCKPTFGRVSLQGVLPVSGSLDHAGPLARSVRDLAILLDAISGTDPRDPHSVDTPPPDVSAALNRRSTERPRIGRLGGLFATQAEPSARQSLEAVLTTLADAGATVSETALPACFETLHRCHRTIMAADAATFHQHRMAEHPDDYQPRIRELIEEGLAVAAGEYLRCREHQRQTSREVLSCFQECDVLACPAALGPAPDVTTTGDPLFNSPWSYTGLPTVSLPVGLAETGLPLAVQLIGRPFAEAELFVAAKWCEDTLRGAQGETPLL